MKALLALLLFVGSASAARCQVQQPPVDQAQAQTQSLAPTLTDTRNSKPLSELITKPEPHLQKWPPLDEPARVSLHDCESYSHHFINIHFNDRPFDTKCESDSKGRILGYRYGPSKKAFWGAFGVAGAFMVAGTEVYERTTYRPALERASAYALGSAGLSAIIAVNLPRLKPKFHENRYLLWVGAYIGEYIGIMVRPLIVGANAH